MPRADGPATALTAPAHLADDPVAWVRARTRRVHPGPADGGRFVLYWAATALRADDNPALDAARLAAHRAGLPLLVYQGLTHRAWYASDRTHTFLLQCALHLGDALARRGIRHVLHLDAQPGAHRTPGALVTLGRDAAAIFVEDFPTGDLPRWQQRLAQATDRPMFAVDTACVLPMRAPGRAYLRAFAFREATAAARRVWCDTAPREDFAPRVAAWEGPIPFVPDVLRPEDIADTVARFAIDHGVGPVHDTPGGEPKARARWDRWRAAHLASYSARRTDAADPDGSSQMSAHLHFGTIAPWRMARDAVAQVGEAGAEKFCDELLTWRELAWTFCAHRPDHATVAALPDWARATLDATRDRRAVRPTLAAIAQGTTGDAFFDLCQRHLVAHGSLHNNARMTWGKTLAAWFADPAEGLRVLEALNHRWALDGRDPSSYGGILWAYGQFDRSQGDAAGGALGAVSVRSGAAHLARVGPKRYRGTVARSRGGIADVLVVGAGASGALAARVLADHGLSVCVLDKGRGPGGRMAARRVGDLRFDHGAHRFTLDPAPLARWREAWLDAGVIAPHPDGGFYCPAGAPALARHLLEGLDVHVGVTVTAVGAQAGRAVVRDASGARRADAVLLTAPTPQSLSLLDAGGLSLPPAMREALEGVRYHRAVVAMVRATAAPEPGAVVGRIVKQSDHTWCLHAHDAWAEAHHGDDDATVAAAMAAACPGAEVLDLKRWRYARPVEGTARPDVAVLSREPFVLIAGDAWAGDASVEEAGGVGAALLAGLAAAGRVLAVRSATAVPQP